jgi:hypothetical protein
MALRELLKCPLGRHDLRVVLRAETVLAAAVHLARRDVQELRLSFERKLDQAVSVVDHHPDDSPGVGEDAGWTDHRGEVIDLFKLHLVGAPAVLLDFTDVAPTQVERLASGDTDGACSAAVTFDLARRSAWATLAMPI